MYIAAHMRKRSRQNADDDEIRARERLLQGTADFKRTMAGACLIVFLVPGLFVLFPGILCGIASHLIEPGLKKALAID